MEGLVDWQPIEADMLEQRSDVIISEELEIFLDGRRGTLMRTARVLQFGAMLI